jgi:TatD DNase family protein
MKYYDTHTHLNHEPLSKNADQIANVCDHKNILLNNIGTNLQTSLQAIELAQKHKNVYATIGIHPCDISNYSLDEITDKFKGLLKIKNNKIVAIGETGLDYHYAGYDKQKQFLFLETHLKIAIEFNLPLIIHVRDAHEDMINFLQNHKTSQLDVVIHCYTSDEIIVKRYIEMGCYISIPGVITFKNAKLIENAIKFIPLDHLLCETDAPWLTPEPHRGKTNSPEFLPFIVKAIATKLNEKEELISDILFENACKLFKVDRKL